MQTPNLTYRYTTIKFLFILNVVGLIGSVFVDYIYDYTFDHINISLILLVVIFLIGYVYYQLVWKAGKHIN